MAESLHPEGIIPLKQSTIDFLKVPDVGNCWQIHSINESKSSAKSFMCLRRSSGIAILFVVVTMIDACKYSSFDFSNSVITPSAVYIFTCMYICIDIRFQLDELADRIFLFWHIFVNKINFYHGWKFYCVLLMKICLKRTKYVNFHYVKEYFQDGN